MQGLNFLTLYYMWKGISLWKKSPSKKVIVQCFGSCLGLLLLKFIELTKDLELLLRLQIIHLLQLKCTTIIWLQHYSKSLDDCFSEEGKRE